MLNIGMMEFIVLMLVAFVIVGPKDLPKVARFLARAYKYAIGLIREITASLNLEEEVEVVKEAVSTVQEIKKTAEDAVNPKNIIAPIEKEIYEIQREVKSAVTNTERALSSVKEEISVVKTQVEEAVDSKNVITHEKN